MNALTMTSPVNDNNNFGLAIINGQSFLLSVKGQLDPIDMVNLLVTGLAPSMKQG